MKFVVTLIKFLGTLLLFTLFGAFLYYTFINPSTSPIPYFSMSNASLIVFVLAAVVFALFSVSAENILDKNGNEAFIKLITEKMKKINGNGTAASGEENNVLNGKLSLLLEQLNSSGSDTHKTLNLGIQQLNDRIDKLESITSAKNEKLAASSSNLETLAAQISANMNSMNASGTPMETDFTPIFERLNMLEENFNSLSGQTMQMLSNLQNLPTASASSSAQEVDLQPVMQQIEQITDALSGIHQSTTQQIAQLNDEVSKIEKQQSDFSHHFDELKEIIEKMSLAQASFTPTPETVASIVTAAAPSATTMPEIERTPVVEEFVAPEPIVEEVAAPEPIVEEAVAPEPVQEVYENKPTETEQRMLADNPYGVQLETAPVDLLPQIETGVNPTLYGSDDPFGVPTDDSLVKSLPDISNNINPNELASDDPFGIPGEGSQIKDMPIEGTGYNADNPFGEPVDLSATADADVPTDLNLTDNDAMSALDNLDLSAPVDLSATDDINKLNDALASLDNGGGNVQENLDKIFNDQLASDLASLDIMQDTTPVEPNDNTNYDEIDLSSLLGEDTSK